mmetsp:Transcript_30568/g.58890  ORF Transcript_30568/g.58890 Transcript_30568/m.58890 type:complete len:439 (-) Transcript_30568:251-1567(-)
MFSIESHNYNGNVISRAQLLPFVHRHLQQFFCSLAHIVVLMHDVHHCLVVQHVPKSIGTHDQELVLLCVEYAMHHLWGGGAPDGGGNGVPDGSRHHQPRGVDVLQPQPLAPHGPAGAVLALLHATPGFQAPFPLVRARRPVVQAQGLRRDLLGFRVPRPHDDARVPRGGHKQLRPAHQRHGGGGAAERAVNRGHVHLGVRLGERRHQRLARLLLVNRRHGIGRGVAELARARLAQQARQHRGSFLLAEHGDVAPSSAVAVPHPKQTASFGSDALAQRKLLVHTEDVLVLALQRAIPNVGDARAAHMHHRGHFDKSGRAAVFRDLALSHGLILFSICPSWLLKILDDIGLQFLRMYVGLGINHRFCALGTPIWRRNGPRRASSTAHPVASWEENSTRVCRVPVNARKENPASARAISRDSVKPGLFKDYGFQVLWTAVF